MQHRAARWVSCNYVRLASVTDMIETLGWRSLAQRRAHARLCLFYKIIHGLVAVPLPSYIQLNTRISRFRQLHTTIDYYKYSFSPLKLSSGMPCLNLLYACQALKLLDIMRQTACLDFNPIMVKGYAALFSCTAVVQASTQ